MKVFALFSLILLSGCGNDDRKEHEACISLPVQRAICFTDMMETYNYDDNMIPWVEDYCAQVYATPICYLPNTNWHNP